MQFPGLLVLVAVPFFTSLAFSQTTAAPAAAQECLAQADAFLHARLPVWKGRLQLNEWEITVVISGEGDLKPNTLGNIHWDIDRKTATIRVLRPAGYRLPCLAAIQDEENTLVHEMVHLELSPLPRSIESRKNEESVVNRITAALLQLGSVGAGETVQTVQTTAGKSVPAHGAADGKADGKADASRAGN